MPNETDAAYLAGFIDGEGYVRIERGTAKRGLEKHRLIVSIANTDIDALRRLAELWERPLYHVRGQKGNKDSARVVWSGRNAADILRRVRPYMLVKAAHADLALEFADRINEMDHKSRRIDADEWAKRESLRVGIAAIQAKRRRADPESVVMERAVVERPLHNLTCARCGSAFTSNDPRSKYCAAVCQRREYAGRYERPTFDKTCPVCTTTFSTVRRDQVFCSPACGRQVQVRRSNKYIKPCAICGKEFIPKNRIHQTCSRECGLVLRAANITKAKVEQPCPSCGESFVARKGQMYCSTQCGAYGRHAKKGLAPQGVKH